MKLIDFMRSKGLKDEDFAELIGRGATSWRVKKWKYGETKPRLEDLARIEEVTDGAVRLSDFIADETTEDATISPQQTIEGNAA